ncbi:MAG TPA: hydantoinase B/oxoprolinase family protein [Alphaproteobacteria bacterium]|nr:hydantoinase B/oxoprolinase family protein [Alphaproteobacteria bacterium]
MDTNRSNPVDPITLEVIRNRFDVIVEEMELTLFKSSHSTIVKEGLDASAALFTADGQTIAQATGIPIHLGALILAVEAILKKFPPNRMQPGDMYVVNDPYAGGTHLPDVVVVVPVFHRAQVVALATTMAHHQEIGGKSPGSVPTDATEVYQEGFRIPPLKLAEGGVLNTTLLELWQQNVRIPDIVMGDLRAQMAAGKLAATRIARLIEEYGVTTMLHAVNQLMDQAEAMMRAQIRRMPPGSYTFADYLDNDGIELDKRVKIEATITVQGSDIQVDFTGTSPQTKGPFNCVPSSTLSAVYYVVRAITDPDTPNNAGVFRPVKVVLPPGTLINPHPPAPVCARTASVKRLADTLLGALVQAMPQRMPAANSGQLLVLSFGGVDPLTGRRFVTSELGAGGMGARPTKDGIDAIDTDVTNCMNIPVEAIELDHPLRIVKNRLWEGSGGAGQYRGGLGYEKVFEVVRGEVIISHRGERFCSQPWGLFGGRPAPNSRSFVKRHDGRTEEIPSKGMYTLYPGDRLHVFVSGGGGYGDPLQREPQRVLEDVLDRKVSLAEARDVYGVVIDEATWTVDPELTAQRRTELAAACGPNMPTYSRRDEHGFSSSLPLGEG